MGSMIQPSKQLSDQTALFNRKDCGQGGLPNKEGGSTYLESIPI
jgi:hypothetical protein